METSFELADDEGWGSGGWRIGTVSWCEYDQLGSFCNVFITLHSEGVG